MIPNRATAQDPWPGLVGLVVCDPLLALLTSGDGPNLLNFLLVVVVVLLIAVVIFAVLFVLAAVRRMTDEGCSILVPHRVRSGFLQDSGAYLIVYRDVLLLGTGDSSPYCRAD